jgi:circadian clock protein KaiC
MTSWQASPVQTGIEGLDDVLAGGFPAQRVYLIQGAPGAGKTTLALQFLLTGVRAGEETLYVTLSETPQELHAVAASHGWSLEGLTIHQMAGGLESPDEDNTLYTPADVELGERVGALLEVIDRVRPSRIVVDACSELRMLAESPQRFRRQIMNLKHGLTQRSCTVLLLDNPTTPEGDVLLQSLVHGVIHMEQLAPLYGAERRRLRVAKLREVRFRGGYHDFTITRGGVVVFPRLVAAEHHQPFTPGKLSSGVPELDAMVGGGLERGTSTLLMGPAGSGKSVLGAQLAVAAAARGQRVAMYLFDEGLNTLLARCAALGMDLRAHLESGRILCRSVDPAELSPGEMVHGLRRAVEEDGVELVLIDSLNGYLNAMPEESFVDLQMHELLSYLRQRGVVTMLVVAQHGIVNITTAPVDVSYLADTVILLRYFESAGRVRKAISVVKHRSGEHEDTIRELRLGPSGIILGPPLAQFRGVLTGVPYVNGAPHRAAGEEPGE